MKPPRPARSTAGAAARSRRRRRSSRRGSLVRLVLGAAMVIAGLAAIGGLVWIGNSDDRLAQRLMFDLGLAAVGLISAAAQVFILLGAWLLWRSWPRRDEESGGRGERDR